MTRIAPTLMALLYAAALALLVLVGLAGCRTTDVVVPYDAPLMLSRDETVHDPYVRQHGQWVLKPGTVTRHAGAIVTLPAATRPAK